MPLAGAAFLHPRVITLSKIRAKLRLTVVGNFGPISPEFGSILALFP